MPRPRRPADVYELKRPRGRRIWYVYWRVNGKPRWQSTGLEGREAAEDALEGLVSSRRLRRQQRLRTMAPSELTEELARRREERSLSLRRGLVYFIQCERTGAIKIGLATNPRNRLTTLQTGSTSRLILLATMPGGRKLEEDLHAAYATERVYGEWFNPCAELMGLVKAAASLRGGEAPLPLPHSFQTAFPRSGNPAARVSTAAGDEGEGRG